MRYLLFVAVVILSGCTILSPQAPTTLDLLQGEWEVTQMQNQPARQPRTLTFSGNTFVMPANNQTEFRGEFTLDDAFTPPRMEINLSKYQNGHVVDSSVAQTKTIVRIEGDTLTMKSDTKGEAFPTDFEAREGTFRMQFKRSGQ